MKKRVFLIVAVSLLATLLIVGFGFVAFVFSIGTAMVDVNVDATVLDRETQTPVGGCLLTFDVDRVADSRTVSGRTDAAGHAGYEVTHGYVAALLGLYPRQRNPDLRFYLGDPPRYGTFDQVESWDVAFRFDMPWFAQEVVPTIEVQRNLAHEDMMSPPPGKQWQQAGFVPIATDPADRLVRANVRFETAATGRETYRIALTLLLDKKQTALCQSETMEEINKRAVALYNAGRHQEALEEYRKVTLRPDAPAWAHRGMGDALGQLGRQKESSDAFRRALDLAPDDREIMYWYANSLITQNDKAAIEQFQKLIALEPLQARGYIGLANAYFELNRFREAIAAFDRAQKLCATCLNDNDREIYADAKRLVR